MDPRYPSPTNSLPSLFEHHSAWDMPPAPIGPAPDEPAFPVWNAQRLPPPVSARIGFIAPCDKTDPRSKALVEECLDAMESSVSYEVFERRCKTLEKQIEHPPTVEAGGRLLVDRVVRFSEGVSTVKALLGHLLADDYLAFLDAHAAELDALLADTLEYNYAGHNFFSARAILDKYCLRPDTASGPVETPCQMYLRAAAHMYLADGLPAVVRAYHFFGKKLCTPATPTLMNAGLKNGGQCSSCFLMGMGDSIKSIMDITHSTGMITAQTGGIGMDLGGLRDGEAGNKMRVRSVRGASLGVDAILDSVSQSSQRRGAATMYLPVWHLTVEDFITYRANTGRSQKSRLDCSDVAVWTFRLFWDRVRADKPWTLFSPHKAKVHGLYGPDFETEYLKYESLAPAREAEYRESEAAVRAAEAAAGADPGRLPELAAARAKMHAAHRRRIDFKVIRARDLLNAIVSNIIETGGPFVLDGDEVNAKSQQANIGVVNNSNLCTEIVQVSSDKEIASCNLASVSLKAFARRRLAPGELAGVQGADAIVSIIARSGAFDFKGLGETTRQLVRNLNKVIDRNKYPVPEKTRDNNMNARPMGIGVSGFGDALKVLGLPYETAAAHAFNRGVFAAMYYHALRESCAQAAEDGPYPLFREGDFTVEVPARTTAAGASALFPHAAAPPTVEARGSATVARLRGSPFSNGVLQMDFWRLRDLAGGDARDRQDPEDNRPIPPAAWGESEPFCPDAENIAPAGPGPDGWGVVRAAVASGVRNSMTLTAMPTATSSQIFGNTESTELHSSNIYSRQVNNGMFVIYDPHFVSDMISHGLWTPAVIDFVKADRGSIARLQSALENDPEFRAAADVPAAGVAALPRLAELHKTMYEISPAEAIMHSRRRAIYFDQTQSLNLFMRDPDVARLRAALLLGAKVGLKTLIYYLWQSKSSDLKLNYIVNGQTRQVMLRADDSDTESDSDPPTLRVGKKRPREPEPAACPIRRSAQDSREDCEACGA